MSTLDPSPRPNVWTVSDAKARLSEVLRLAREEGPQRIGAREPVVVVSEAEWRRLNAPKPHLGAWLVANMPKGLDLDLPSRVDRNREPLFGDEGA
ncbi:MAG: type II toxin-antitoxin system prevent-host-death family antitoxin [Maricaulaceae bacterium]